MKYSPSQERKQSKNHFSPVKLESKKNDEKVIVSREKDGWSGTIDRPGKTTSRLIVKRILYLYFHVHA